MDVTAFTGGHSMSKLNLREYITSKQKKQFYVDKMFEKIAPVYDSFTVVFSFNMDRRWKQELVNMLDLHGDEKILDLACGTGDIAFALGQRVPAGKVIGMDILPSMIDIAESKRKDKNSANVEFLCDDILNMPFDDAAFNHVTCGYALRNVPDIEAAIGQIFRVLKPGGRFLSLDFAHPPNKIYRWLYFNYLVVTGSAAGYLIHGDPDVYRYIPESLKLYPGQSKVQSLMEQAGFIDAGYREFGGGIMAINYGTKP